MDELYPYVYGSSVINSVVPGQNNYRKVSNIRRTLVGNKIVDHSDVVGASPVGAWLQWIGQKRLQDETRNVYVWG